MARALQLLAAVALAALGGALAQQPPAPTPASMCQAATFEDWPGNRICVECNFFFGLLVALLEVGLLAVCFANITTRFYPPASAAQQPHALQQPYGADEREGAVELADSMRRRWTPAPVADASAL
jgi:hypothetical protein